jgi:hypothetical protein
MLHVLITIFYVTGLKRLFVPKHFTVRAGNRLLVK